MTTKTYVTASLFALALIGTSCISTLQAQAETLWGALAAGIDQNGSSSTVAVGSAVRHRSKSEASSAALAQCRKNGVSNCRVISTFTGCGFITTSSDGSSPVAWGSGGSKQEAYNECYARIRRGNCDVAAIGGCN